jgi:hypothetical protein
MVMSLHYTIVKVLKQKRVILEAIRKCANILL